METAAERDSSRDREREAPVTDRCEPSDSSSGVAAGGDSSRDRETEREHQ